MARAVKVPEEPLLFARTGVLSGWWESGLCLMCRREGVPVIWLGPVIHGARHAPFYSCETCTGWLVRYVGTHDHDAPPPAPPSSPAPVGELGLRYVVAALGVLTVAGAVGSLWLAFSGRPP